MTTRIHALMLGLLLTGPLEAEEMVTLQAEPVARWLTLDGRVEPINQGTVAAQTSGRVVRMLVDVNDRVETGAPLLEISGNEQSAAVEGAKARLARAQAQQSEADRQLTRFQALSVKGVVTRSQLDNAQAAALAARAEVKAADAALVQAREAFGYTRILAPYGGVVTARHVELGETVVPGTPLLSGLSLDALRVESELPQSLLGSAALQSDAIEVLLPGGAIQPLRIKRFDYADPQSHTFRLRLDLPERQAGVLPGMWVKVRVRLGERNALMIPAGALLRQGELSAVYLRHGEAWTLTPVRVGESEGERVEILAGLKAGDRIAADAWARVREGDHEQ
ncbi:efflux RND transporter periplasmic adaptor subunit [Aeromonas schubertii]|nr:efflux RND transporter periplasmic adaptor subunit [Aeromonas schubertii]